MTLEEIDSAETLASNLEKIELPDHLVAVLVDPLLQKFMMLRPDKDLKRAWAWMDTQLAEILNGDADEGTLTNTLNIIYEYARITKVSPSNLACYLTRILNIKQDISPFFHAFIKLVEQSWQLQSGNSKLIDVLAYAPIVDAEGEE